MLKRILISSILLVQLAMSGCQGAAGSLKASLDREFSLSAGQTAELTSERITLEFVGIQEDSRCPKGATCVWQGRVSSTVKVEDNGSTSTIVLSEPGLSSQPGNNVYKQYKFISRVLPYPELNKKITREDYRLFLTVTRVEGQNQ
jgi:hypothetical protein